MLQNHTPEKRRAMSMSSHCNQRAQRLRKIEDHMSMELIHPPMRETPPPKKKTGGMSPCFRKYKFTAISQNRKNSLL